MKASFSTILLLKKPPSLSQTVELKVVESQTVTECCIRMACVTTNRRRGNTFIEGGRLKMNDVNMSNDGGHEALIRVDVALLISFWGLK